jgi:hypothetical protein
MEVLAGVMIGGFIVLAGFVAGFVAATKAKG